MLILTDDGPLNCDNANPTVRDMRSGRPPRTPAQRIQDDKKLVAMVRQWAASQRHAHDSIRSTSKDQKMPRFNAAALLQRPESRSGEAFANHIAARTNPLAFWKQRLRNASRSVSRHAFDSAPDHEEALKHLERMSNHIAARGGTSEFDPAYLGQCFMSMLKAMGSTEDEEEDAADIDPDQVTDPSIHGGPSNVRARDGSKNPDHCKDFNDIAEGGADSALFDANSLFQRGER